METRGWSQSIGDQCGFAEICRIGARLNDRHSETERPDFLGQRFMRSFHRSFRGAVEADERHRRDPKAARNTGNVPAPLLPQQGQSCSQHSSHAKAVRIEQVSDLFVTRLPCSRKQACPRIVHKNVQSAEVRVRLPHGLLHLLGVGYVENQRKDSVAEALRRRAISETKQDANNKVMEMMIEAGRGTASAPLPAPSGQAGNAASRRQQKRC